MNQKNDDYISNTEELIFKEEVADEELHSKLGVDDHIYVRKFFGAPFLIGLAIFLILTSLLAAILGLIVFDKELTGRPIGVFHDEYKLTVVHSNKNYGGTVKSFSNYNNSGSSFNYVFHVENKNAVNLKYSVELENPNFGSDNIDQTKISYMLLKNKQVVKNGSLSNMKTNDLYKTTISGKSVDEYEIKIWGDNINNDLNFSFKINIGV